MADGSKKLINDVDNCVDECLEGLAGAYPSLVLHPAQRVLFDGQPNERRKVAIVSGAGAGHEPFSVGYVGPGMLTAAVSGSVFASPPSSHVLHAIRLSARVSPGGVYVIIPNYTGDILNFGLAVQLAKAEGIKVDSLIAGEDISLESHGVKSRAGRRGMTGVVILYKIIGSLSKSGATLAEISEMGSKILNNVASISLGLKPCTLPGASAPLFKIEQDEMELGIGVHGEAGVQRLKMMPAKDAVGYMLNPLKNHFQLKSGDKVAVTVNNLGGLSYLEQCILAGEVKKQLNKDGIIVARVYTASFFTSLDMAGVLISCLRLPKENEECWLSALDDETSAPAWPGRVTSMPTTKPQNFARSDEETTELKFIPRGPEVSTTVASFISSCLDQVTSAIVAAEERLNILDSGCGDGDCGTTLRYLANGVQRELEKGKLNLRFPATLASELAAIAATTMGGTSGAIYSLFLTYAGSALEESKNIADPKTWVQVWRSALQGVQKHSTARVGDRTMFDALEPAFDAFEESTAAGMDVSKSLELARIAAEKGCDKTKSMLAMAGRASYVDSSQLKDVDAGAYAVTVWMGALRRCFK